MTFLERGDARIRYAVSGAGPPVLMIQGIGVTGEGWRPQVRELAGEFQMLCFDNRGIGASECARGPISIEAMAQDALALMDAVGWASAHVVGHSMGGVIAQQLALDAPGRVRSLSLLCTFPRGRDGARITPWVLWMTLRTRVGSRVRRRRAFLEMLYPAEYLRSVDLDALAAETGSIVGRDLADQGPVLMRQLRALARHDCSGRLGELAGVPALVLSARHDPIAPPCCGRRLARLVPGARYVELPGASHGVTIQMAGEVNRLLREFLRAVPA